MTRIVVGTAGWSIPAKSRAEFPENGTHLERYAQIFSGVEINSTFYKPHQPRTFERWAASTPADFRFAVKLTREITHERKLVDCDALFSRFVGEVSHLGEKLGPILVQLPPSLGFDKRRALSFLDLLRSQFAGDVALEPRHESWFTPSVDHELRARKIARVKADPAKPTAAEKPGGTAEFAYYRLHGSPRIYWSNYADEYLHALAQELAERRDSTARLWCIFDNTAQGFATENALKLQKMICTR